MHQPPPFQDTTLKVETLLTGLALAENMGDVNDYLPWLADALGQPRPEWCESCQHFVFPFNAHEHAEDEHSGLPYPVH